MVKARWVNRVFTITHRFFKHRVHRPLFFVHSNARSVGIFLLAGHEHRKHRALKLVYLIRVAFEAPCHVLEWLAQNIVILLSPVILDVNETASC